MHRFLLSIAVACTRAQKTLNTRGKGRLKFLETLRPRHRVVISVEESRIRRVGEEGSWSHEVVCVHFLESGCVEIVALRRIGDVPDPTGAHASFLVDPVAGTVTPKKLTALTEPVEVLVGEP